MNEKPLLQRHEAEKKVIQSSASLEGKEGEIYKVFISVSVVSKEKNTEIIHFFESERDSRHDVMEDITTSIEEAFQKSDKQSEKIK